MVRTAAILLAFASSAAVAQTNPVAQPTKLSADWQKRTRAMFETPDMIAQHRLLNEVGAMIDSGLIVTTAAQELAPINAANLLKAHAQIESGTTIGKVVLSGW